MGDERNIVIAGASGLIGKKLVTALLEMKYRVSVISRDKLIARQTFPDAEETMEWKDTAQVTAAIDGAYGVINLAGAPLIGRRWTAAYKKILHDSRIDTTIMLATIIHNVKNKPKVFISGSAVGIYGMQDKETPFTEHDSPAKDLLGMICKEWEDAAYGAEKDGVRVVCIRTAIVLDTQEGALPKMLLPFRFFAGGPIGTGRQAFPWIHIDDEAGIILYALEHEAVKGPVNAAAPDMVTNKEFSNVIGKVIKRPSWLPIPEFALRLLYGEAAQVLTTGVKVSSEKIVRWGYTFKHPRLEEALKERLGSSI
jgi:uncharacterized protein (TIGR01777 family)